MTFPSCTSIEDYGFLKAKYHGREQFSRPWDHCCALQIKPTQTLEPLWLCAALFTKARRWRCFSAGIQVRAFLKFNGLRTSMSETMVAQAQVMYNAGYKMDLIFKNLTL